MQGLRLSVLARERTERKKKEEEEGFLFRGRAEKVEAKLKSARSIDRSEVHSSNPSSFFILMPSFLTEAGGGGDNERRGEPRPQSRRSREREQAALRLDHVRHQFNRHRLHHRLQITDPELDKISSVSLPFIKDRVPVFGNGGAGSRAKRNGEKAKKRWRKTKMVLQDVIALAGKDKVVQPSREGAAKEGRAAKNKVSLANSANLFSPVKQRKNSSKEGGYVIEPGAGSTLFKKYKGGVNFHQSLDSDAKIKQQHRAPDSGKPPLIPKSALEAAMLKPRIIPQSKTTLEKRNKRVLKTREKERQMKLRIGVLDEMMYKLEDKPTMTNEDILRIIAYMDEDNSGEVDENEFSNAVRAAKRGQIEDDGIANLMARVDNELRIKQIRLKDLFKQLDASGDGMLSVSELQFGLNMLCDVSWEKECERRKLKRLANHERWKVRAAVKRL